MNALGECTDCHGDLCMRADEVCCARCGAPQPDHPGMKRPAVRDAPQPKPHETARESYIATTGDRVLELEKLTRAQAATIVSLDARLAALEHAGVASRQQKAKG